MSSATIQLREAAILETEKGCPECGGNVSVDSAEAVCDDCGLVVDEARVDYSVSRSEMEMRRAARLTTRTRHDNGLGTDYIGYFDPNGDRISKDRWWRVQQEHNRAQFDGKGERNVAYGLGEIGRIAGALRLSRVVRETASVIFRRASDEGLIPGRDLDSMAAASVAAATRISGAPYGVEAVAEHGRTAHRRIFSAYQYITRELELPTPPPTIAEFVPQIASEVGLPADLESEASELGQRADASGVLSGCKPQGGAAACVYGVTAGLRVDCTQKRLAAAAGCCDITVRHNWRRLREAGLLNENGRRP